MVKSKKYSMFIDETGSPEDTGPFTVTGVIFEYKYAHDNEQTGVPCILREELNKFKIDCFQRSDFNFHLKDILSGNKPFRQEDGVTKQQLIEFWNKLPQFLSKLDFKIISVTVNKEKLTDFYSTPKDPYIVAFGHIMESFYSFINQSHVESARIILESRDDFKNLKIQQAFFDIFNTGTVHMDVASAKSKIKGFMFADKKSSQAGLEIADLVCNPLSRARRGLVEVNPRAIKYGNENKIFESLKNKIYNKDSGQDFRNWGFKLVPITKKMRDWASSPKTKKTM